MYTLILWIQYIGILVLVVEAMYIIRQKPSKQQLTLLVVILSTLVNFVGYLFEIQADNKEMALQAVKILYLGKPYIILATFLFAMEFYRIQVPAAVRVMLCAIHACISFLVFTCDYHNLFYSSKDYTQEGFFPHLVLGHSPIYMAYSGLVLVYLLVLMGSGIYRYSHMNSQKERKQILYMVAVTCVAGVGFVVYFSGLMKGYDSTLPAYLICAVLLLIAMVRYDLLDAVSLVKDNMFDELPDGLLVVDNFRHIAYANVTMKVLYPDYEKQDGRAVLEELNRVCEENETLEKGNHRIYEVNRKEIIKDDVSYGQMYVAKDVTQHRMYTAQLEEQTNIAKKANQAKSDFLAKMSHEIRTPINAVLGMNEMILRESEQVDITHYAMDIKTSANALLTIINDILDTSKIESGKLQILPVNYELDSLLNDVFNMAFVKAGEKDLAFQIHVDEQLPNGLVGDDVRIRQILVNLLNNAVKYTEQGSVTLSVTRHQKEKKAEVVNTDDINNVFGARQSVRLRYEVQDTGIGIKEEDLPKLTAAFERIEEYRNREIEGTGLGMNIVVELLKMMGSSLEVHSVYGKGTTFAFELQQFVWNEETIGNFEERSERFHQHQEYATSFVAPEARILVVDDNAINRNVLRGLLKQNGIQIQEAESGYRCLECVREQEFDLIIMDHMMPGMDGVETFHRLQTLEGNKSKDAPVIILTANAVVGAKGKYLREGFTDYLSKPIQAEKLEELIMKYLPEEKLQQEESVFEKSILLPEIDEFDFDYARRFIQDDTMLIETIIDVYKALESKKEILERAYRNIIESGPDKGEETMAEAMKEYQIEVHSLKSDTAMIGALLLSKLARLLEVSAQEGDVERIRTLHPVLTDELGKHKERMAFLAQEWEGAGDSEVSYDDEIAADKEGTENEEEGEIWI